MAGFQNVIFDKLGQMAYLLISLCRRSTFLNDCHDIMIEREPSVSVGHRVVNATP